MLFAGSFRHSQARATSLPEGGIAVGFALGGLGLLCGLSHTDRRGRRSLQYRPLYVAGYPTRTVVDAGPYTTNHYTHPSLYFEGNLLANRFGSGPKSPKNASTHTKVIIQQLLWRA